jgi:glutathione S-transferase
MATVLRGLEDEPVLAKHPTVAAYLERCLARPAFSEALAAQLATFAEHRPGLRARNASRLRRVRRGPKGRNVSIGRTVRPIPLLKDDLP